MLVLKEKSNPTLNRHSTFCILGTVSVFNSRVGICKVLALKRWFTLTKKPPDNLVKNIILMNDECAKHETASPTQ